MTETLTMSKKELKRIAILHQIADGTLTVTDAAHALELSVRQMIRVHSRFMADGEAGLIHKLRGRRSNYRHAESLREQVLRLYRTQYFDYGPTLFCEELERGHGITLSNETARQWLMGAGLWAGSRKKHPHRKKRPRRKAIGEMVQFDGSPHDWFEGRGPACTLLHAIDDASNQTFLRLATSENTADCMRAMRAYVERYGIPQELYVDYGSVFYDETGTTQFVRAMTELGTRVRYAPSPQAKGRVERGNRTHQDRLIKRMRQANICSIQGANAFLDAEYLDYHNTRFAFPDGLPNVHQSIAGVDLDKIFCILDIRVVANDYTIQLNGCYIQLERSEAPLPPPRASVTVRRFLDDSLHVYWNDNELAFTLLAERPRKPARRPPVVAPDHAWRAHNRRLKKRKPNDRTRIMTPP